jgi:hypothetical protein
MNAMYSIVAHPQTPASVPKFQVLLDKILKNGVDDKLRKTLASGWADHAIELMEVRREDLLHSLYRWFLYGMMILLTYMPDLFCRLSQII